VTQVVVAPGSVAPAELGSLVRARPDGRLVITLGALAGSAVPLDLHRARRAVARLDAIEFAVSADVAEPTAESVIEIVWTPVTAIVDLMLDWDLLELDITLAELTEWLEVGQDVVARALGRLGSYSGVTVRQAGDDAVVRVRLDVDSCPLTMSASGSATGSA
jgi:hypothetical protein